MLLELSAFPKCFPKYKYISHVSQLALSGIKFSNPLTPLCFCFAQQPYYIRHVILFRSACKLKLFTVRHNALDVEIESPLISLSNK